MFKQYLVRHGLDPTTAFDVLKYDNNHRQPLINCMIRLLRIATLMKYFMQYSELSKSSR
jgi:hypothetical protein